MTIKMRSRILIVGALIGWCGAACAQSATTTFTYDALGRIVTVSTAGGPASGENTTITYDPAGNRVNHTVAGVPGGLMAIAPPQAEASSMSKQ